MGLGEPLPHSRFPDMVRLAKSRGLRAEVTTNALLLDDEIAGGLLPAGLDQLVVSIDGASAEAFGRVRSGAGRDTTPTEGGAVWKRSADRGGGAGKTPIGSALRGSGRSARSRGRPARSH